MSQIEIQKLETQIGELTEKLAALRKSSSGQEIKNYQLKTMSGEVSLFDLFGGRNQLLAIHNMGQGCRYCTVWADGLNDLLPHLEDSMAVVLLSKDSPEAQRQFANSRGWKFRLASHGDSDYMNDQNLPGSGKNAPGAVLYERKNGTIIRKNWSTFGPGDQFCALWHFLSLAGIGDKDWTPQYSYWQRPKSLDDGGKNII